MSADLFSSPRWYLRYFQFIERLPIPKWLLAGLVIVGSAAVHHLVAWQGGHLARGQFDFSLANLGIYYVFVPYTWIIIANRADRDLKSFFSSSGRSEKNISEIITDFNSLPEITSLIVVIIGSLNGFYNYRFLGIPNIPLSEVVLPGIHALNWIVSAVLGYMTIVRLIRQSILMRQFYSEYDVDIFKPERIHALSRYGAFTSTALLMLFYVLVFLSFPTFIFTSVGLLSQVLVFFTIVLVFFIPLSGINQRMRLAKDKLLNNVSEDLRDLNHEIHAAAKARDYAALEKFQAPLATLRDSRDMIKAIPTWPWQPNTLRNLFAPLLFPVVVFLIQLFIERVIG